MAEEKPTAPEKQGNASSGAARDFFKEQANTPVLREMRQFRAVRWMIPFSLLAFVWIVDAHLVSKGVILLVVVFGIAIYFEIQALSSKRESEPGHSAQNEQDKT
jgi:membrane protein insertase Oxa1/YidC/SpoIIIJ